MATLSINNWVGTGPLTMVEFPQTSGVLVMPMLASKNEFAYLREKGYKAAQKTGRTQNARQAGNYLRCTFGKEHLT